MRQRSYYSDFEIITNQYTFGQEWQLEDGTEYIGLYHKYIPTDEVYTKGTWIARESKKLVNFTNLSKLAKQYKQLKPDVVTKYDSILQTIITPKSEDYVNGYMNRYFIKKYNENYIQEIDDTQYTAWLSKKIDNNLYNATEIKWYITGEINDIKLTVSTTVGVFNKNKRSLFEAEQKMPGISKLITNYLQYYKDTDYNIPADINVK